jgi:hypothetical protein
LLRALPRKAATLALAVAAGTVFGATLMAGPAQAHESEITGVATCKDANWQVTWTVKNLKFNGAETPTEVKFSPQPLSGALPQSIAAFQSATATMTFPGSAKKITVDFVGLWETDHFTFAVHGEVVPEGQCGPPPTTPAAQPSPSKSAPPPALVVTGAPTAGIAAGGGLLVAAGAALVLFLRRRRSVKFVAE